jgi:bacteriocin biosynthesis cyclodehydratase domain-containing protein
MSDSGVISDGDRFRVHPWLRAVRDRDAYLFEYGGRLVRIAGDHAVPLLSALLPLLDGSRTVEAVQRCLSDWERAAVAQALSVLASNGIITPVHAMDPTDDGEHLLTAIMGPCEAGVAINQAHVGVMGGGPLAQTVAALCRQSGVGRVTVLATGDATPGALDLVTAAADGSDLPYLDAWNRSMLEQSQPWLLVLPFDGVYGAVGPLFIPPETACYACLRTRRRSVLEDPDLAETYDEQPTYHPMGAAVTSLMAGLAVHLALRWITRRDASVAGMLYAVGLLPQPSVTAHEVFPVPRCPACRPMAQHTPAPWPPGGDWARSAT